MNGQLKILHLEDLPSDAELIHHELKRGELKYELRLVDNRKDYQDELEHFAPDIILSDHALPSFTSTDALDILKQKGKKIPFILITSTISEEFAAEIMKAGADDYILKDRLIRLNGAIVNALDKWRLERQKQEYNNRIVQNEIRFRALIENNNDGIILIDKERVIVYASPSFERITGYSGKEYIGIKGFRVTHPEDGSVIQEKIDYALENPGEVVTFESRIICKTGETIWIEGTVQNMMHIPSLNGIVCNFRNITDRRNAERKLIRRENFYRALIEKSTDLKILVDDQGTIRYGSSSMKLVLGYEPDEYLGQNVFPLMHPEDRAVMEQRIPELISKPGESIRVRKRLLHKNGQWRWVSGTLTNLLQDPSVEALVANLRDITARILAVDALQKSEANLRTIFDHSDTGYILFDTSFRILSYNQLAQKFSSKDLNIQLEPGEYVLDYFPDKQKEVFQEMMDNALKGNIASYEINYPQADGSQQWYYTRVFPVKDKEDHVIGLIMALTDFTERKLAEIEKDLMAADMIQRNKDLEQFAYIVSHNLRAPVANIIGFSEELKNENPDPGQQEVFLDQLSVSVSRLDQVIRDLSRILQVKREINERKELVNFSMLVKDIRSSIAHLIESEKAVINTDFSETGSFYTLRSYLYSIFFNLIMNSIKYHCPGVAPIITIRSRKDPETGLLTLVFNDNGMGIDLSRWGDQVFGLYKRFHHNIEGKGIGLFMTKTQVETLNGRISIQSEVTRGTTFTIVFNTVTSVPDHP